MEGPEVRSLQAALVEKGYEPGATTGFFDDETESAVKAFQKAEGLSETGEADPETLAKLTGLVDRTLLLKMKNILKEEAVRPGLGAPPKSAGSGTALVPATTTQAISRVALFSNPLVLVGIGVAVGIAVMKLLPKDIPSFESCGAALNRDYEVLSDEDKPKSRKLKRSKRED